MRSKVMNTIPSRKAKERTSEAQPPKTPEQIENTGENVTEAVKPDDRGMLDDKKRKAEARKAFEAGVRGKLKYSRKR